MAKNKKHKKQRIHQTDSHVAANKPIRISLIDWQSFWLTLGLVVILATAMIGAYLLGWDDGLLGGLAVLLVGVVFCTLLFDIGLLLTACITIDDGMVNAGKDSTGQQLVFHADKVERIEVRDRAGNVLPDGEKKYRRVNLTFVMESGRTNPRPMNVLTQKQLQKIKKAFGK